METQNLWPDFVTEKIGGPKAILIEQATYLSEKTNGVLTADVETTVYEDNFFHRFYVVATSLNNYRYELFALSHRVNQYYPVRIITQHDEFANKNLLEANNEKEFLEQLSMQFKQPEVVGIISLLLSQSIT